MGKILTLLMTSVIFAPLAVATEGDLHTTTERMYPMSASLEAPTMEALPVYTQEEDPTQWGFSYAFSLKKDKYGLITYDVGDMTTNVPLFGSTKFDINLMAGLSVLTQDMYVGAGLSVRYTKDVFFASFGASILTPSGSGPDMWKGADFVITAGFGIFTLP